MPPEDGFKAPSDLFEARWILKGLHRKRDQTTELAEIENRVIASLRSSLGVVPPEDGFKAPNRSFRGKVYSQRAAPQADLANELPR